jgi:hypothetical protein
VLSVVNVFVPVRYQQASNLPGRGIAQGRTTFLADNPANSALGGNCGEFDQPTRLVSRQPSYLASAAALSARASTRRKAFAICGWSLPESSHTIGEGRVGGDQCQAFDKRSRADQAVEGVFVVKRQGCQGIDMLRFYG